MKTSARPARQPAATDLVILPDGTIHAHQLTPALAAVLAALNPADTIMVRRALPHSPVLPVHPAVPSPPAPDPSSLPFPPSSLPS